MVDFNKEVNVINYYKEKLKDLENGESDVHFYTFLQDLKETRDCVQDDSLQKEFDSLIGKYLKFKFPSVASKF